MIAGRNIFFATAILFLNVASHSQTNNLSDAEIQGHNLAQRLLEQQPATNFIQTGVLKIREANGTNTDFPVKFVTVVTETNWQTTYTADFIHYDNSNNFGWRGDTITIIHESGQPNQYKNRSSFIYGSKFRGEIMTLGPVGRTIQILSDKEIITPFTDSDFWICDLGLEFFHWPEQKILKKEMHRSRGCTVLESTNPNPAAQSYSRVVSWIDEETLGIVEAYAYDANGKLLKDFYPKDFKKVRGQWQVQTLVMENVQTGSRSRLEFDLKK
jgi:hypothetical protein